MEENKKKINCALIKTCVLNLCSACILYIGTCKLVLIYCLYMYLDIIIIISQASELIALLEEGVRTHYVPPHLAVVSSLLGLLLLSSYMYVRLCKWSPDYLFFNAYIFIKLHNCNCLMHKPWLTVLKICL